MLIDHDDDQLNEFDQSVVGKVCRIEIPLQSPSALLQVADLIRGLANQCEFAATDKSSNARMRMFSLMMYAREVNRRMKKLRGRGRPPRSLVRYSTHNMP